MLQGCRMAGRSAWNSAVSANLECMLQRALTNEWSATLCSRDQFSSVTRPPTGSAWGRPQTSAASPLTPPASSGPAATPAMPSTASSSPTLRSVSSAACASASACGACLVPGSSGPGATRFPGGARAGVSVSATEIRAGMLLEHEGKLLEVLSQMHNAGQARQGGNVMLDCRDVRTSTKTKLKVAPAKALEVAETSKRKLQFLYEDEEGVHVMDATTFDQFAVPHSAATRVKDWLQDGLELYALMHEGAPVVLEVPQAPIEVTVASCVEARVSAAGGRKPATVSTGATVMVPSFVQQGERILVNPSSGEFVRRV